MSYLQVPGSLVSVQWLSQHHLHPKIKVFDASWHMPAANRNAFVEWQQKRIPGAVFFDFDGRVCCPDTELPHMLPSADLFTQEVQRLGVDDDSCIVIYDSMGIFSAPRAWWMLRAMGFDNCAVLNGGLPAWVEGGHPLDITEVETEYPLGNFVARYTTAFCSDANAVLAALQNPQVDILDARSTGRFEGREAEPRPGLRSGHMPGAKNLPFDQLIENGHMKSPEVLTELFQARIDTERDLILTCGSGITACVLAFAAHLIGHENFSVYDGSWCEWGASPDLPVV